VGPELLRGLVARCIGVARVVVGMEADPGYGSMEEEECVEGVEGGC
jgi:hypothetical protein